MYFYCRKAPPSFITINNREYKIETDFFLWAITFMEIIEELEDSLDDDEKIDELMEELKEIFFIDGIYESPTNIIQAMNKFYQGYPSYIKDVDTKEEKKETGYESDPILDFRYDLNLIIVAIRNQSGIDLSHRSKDNMHWWDFLLEVQSLTDNHKISQIMSYRGYEGKDREMLRIKEKVRIKKPLSKARQKALEEVDELFYNS